MRARARVTLTLVAKAEARRRYVKLGLEPYHVQHGIRSLRSLRHGGQFRATPFLVLVLLLRRHLCASYVRACVRAGGRGEGPLRESVRDGVVKGGTVATRPPHLTPDFDFKLVRPGVRVRIRMRTRARS